MEAQLQLVQATARLVRHVLHAAMAVECCGYVVNHPSQVQHHCLFLSGEACIRYCLDQALLLADWESVKEEFWSRITLDPSYCPTSFHDVEWFQNLWSDEDWWEQLMSALLAQEHPDDVEIWLH